MEEKYFADDRFIISDEIMAMSIEELDREIARFEEEARRERDRLRAEKGRKERDKLRAEKDKKAV